MFLRELQIAQPSQPARGYGFSLCFGTALMVLGTIVSVSSPWRYVRLVRDLNNGGAGFRHPSRSAIGITLVLALVGAAMAAAVISVSRVRE